MIGSYIEGVLTSASASSVTEIFIWLMLAIFAMAVLQGKSGKHGLFMEHAPAVLVSLGILGTFVGIVIGLLDFDAHDIKGSIEGLLDGLRTAFITSLVGMTLSIVLKALDAWWFAPARGRAEQPDSITPEHIHGVLTQQVRLLEGLNQSLAGNEEGSVAGQLKLMRTDVSDFRNALDRTHREFQDKLFVQLNQFGEMLAKSATETVIEALRQVIQDFNKHLVEQFGDNFKALNESVGKMNEWQELYKQHVEALEERIELAINELERTATANEAISRSLSSSEQSIGSIDNHCQSIPTAIGQLEPVLQVNQHQIQELQRHLDAFVAMRDQATSAVPQLQLHMETLSGQLAEGMKGVMTTMHEGAQEFGRSVDLTNAALTESAHVVSSRSEQIAENMQDAAQEFGSSVRGTLENMLNNSKALEQQMGQAIEQAASSMIEAFRQATGKIEEGLTGSVEATMNSLRSSVEGSLSQTEAQIQGSANRTMGAVEAQVREATERASASLHIQLNAMDQAIGRELEKVFKEMGSALATISRRIADDHAELAQRVRA
ncbi:Apolipoprotein A1/A4/E domain protein [compost metagenome]